MPGNVISAICPCGYQTELYPGVSEFTHKLYAMAYSKQGYEVSTYKETKIAKKELIRIIDPFVDDDDEETDIIQKRLSPTFFDWVRQRDLETINCPRCKKNSLKLSLAGHWD